MPSSFRTQKNLGDWLELDGHRRPRRLRRWRSLLGWATLIVCGAGVTGALVLPRGPRVAQAGPLTIAHGMFNDNCSACHEDSFQTVKKLGDWGGGVHAVSDSACEKCHEGAPHNEHVREKVACATCHREHRGKMSLRDVADGHCVSCHGDLSRSLKAGDSPRFPNVQSFDRGHPPIRKRTDPGQVHFNHKAHLNKKGIPSRDGRVIQLDCADCHRLDAAGQYLEPIRYENHCANCHPLTVRLTGDLTANPRDVQQLRKAESQFNAIPAPHDRPEVVRAVLRERLLEFVQDFPMVAGDTGERLFDSKLLGRRGIRPPSENEWRWTRERLGTVERLLFPEQQKQVNEQVLFENAGGCRFCHVSEGRREGSAGLGALPFYRATENRTRWMHHSRFNHEKHRVLRCTECHEAEGSEKTADVLMPGLDTCRKCHNPSVGARHDCVECHSYHNPILSGGRERGRTIKDCLGK